MSNQLTPQDVNLVKRVRLQMIIIGVLILLLIAALFYYFFNNTTVLKTTTLMENKFLRSVDDGTATSGLTNYMRTSGPTQLVESQGVYYDSAEIANYLRTEWPEITKRHRDYQTGANVSLPNKNCVWKIGFYWMAREDATTRKPKLGFYVVPIIVDTMSKQVYDYFNVRNNSYYEHQAGKNNIFDEGQLWP